MSALPSSHVNVVKVIAYVELESLTAKEAAAQRFRESERATKPAKLERIVANILDPTKYQMEVTLTAELGDGRQIRSGKRFRFFGSRDGSAAIWHRYRVPTLPRTLMCTSGCCARTTTWD